MEEKLAIDITANANAMMSPFNIKHGQINIGQPGIDFVADNMVSYMQFPWASIEYISADIFLGFYYRGIYVVLKDGNQYQFVTSKTKKLLEASSKYLTKDQIRYRKNSFQRSIDRRKENKKNDRK